MEAMRRFATTTVWFSSTTGPLGPRIGSTLTPTNATSPSTTGSGSPQAVATRHTPSAAPARRPWNHRGLVVQDTLWPRSPERSPRFPLRLTMLDILAPGPGPQAPSGNGGRNRGGTCPRLYTMNVRLNVITILPSWLKPVDFTLTIPTVGRDFDSRFSNTSLRE